MPYDLHLLSVSDVAAAAVGYLYADTMGSTKPTMQAGQSFVVSIIARIASRAGVGTNVMGKLDDGQKNQLIVALLSALSAGYRGGSILKGVLSGTSIDLLAEDVLRILNIEDRNFFQMGDDINGTPAAKSSIPPPGYVTGSTHSYPESGFAISRIS